MAGGDSQRARAVFYEVVTTCMLLARALGVGCDLRLQGRLTGFGRNLTLR